MNERVRKRTKIVATIGPASRDPATLRALVDAGLNVARLNFSHGTHEEHGAVIADLRRVSREAGVPVGILQDLPGPKVRTGTLAGGVPDVPLENGASFSLATSDIAGTARGVSVSYGGLARDVDVGKLIYLADGAIALRVVAKTNDRIDTIVEVGGNLRAQQGINYPDGTLAIEAVTDRDFEHLEFGLAQGIDWVAVSFVKTAEDVLRVKRFIAERGKYVPVIAKIEKHEALEVIDEIVAAADAIMVARGDLGIEIPLERVPHVQKDLIARANSVSKPVITATQMLESMISSPRPTRAEATDVANAIIDGTDAVMLSGETARGAYPVEAVRTMATIAREIERDYPHDVLRYRRISQATRTIESSIAEGAAQMAEELDLRYIVTGTTTGNTARHISSFRPRANIVAMTPIPGVARRMALVWGVEALVVESYKYIETLIDIVEARMLRENIAARGETIVITSGMPVGEGGTNVIKVHRLP
ncbi:MAG: pyruvate kinase [Candidatus Eremiobacteraeota bacterium]|nr:pyruvate kinase [Candidatus Eremiobacteraeota bacterium]